MVHFSFEFFFFFFLRVNGKESVYSRFLLFYYVTTDDVFLIIGLKCLFECDDDAGCDLLLL